jgi:hypothetical protein
LNCGNDGIEYARRRQTTRDDLRIRHGVDGINTVAPFLNVS